MQLLDAALAVAGAVLLALTFPKVNAAWLAPLGVAALFFSWRDASWKRAFALGWFPGILFFTISFWWWSTTIVHDVGAFAYLAVLGGAALEALAWGAAAILATIAWRRAPRAIAPLAVAAAFAAAEWVRSIGVMGAPFAQLAYPQVNTPLRVFGAYIGASGVTFVVCIIGAYFADAVTRRSWRNAVIAYASIIIVGVVAWLAWPARILPPATIPVAAIQGNIVQTLKWKRGGLAEALARYTTLTRSVMAVHPKLIVWPETVIALRGEGLNQDAVLGAQFAQLARTANATLVVGSIDVHDAHYYNALYIYAPSGLQAIYDKRQLVPFAEYFPGKSFLGWLPYVGELNGDFTEGDVNGVYTTLAGLRIAPLICWESAFGDLAHAQLAKGAQLLVVSTDDAWFGTSSGPYQHAQIAQMRAIESGAYVVRAAATGISGIIAPNGTWRARAGLDREAAIVGDVGPPVGSLFARIGPSAVFWALALLYVISVFAFARARSTDE